MTAATLREDVMATEAAARDANDRPTPPVVYSVEQAAQALGISKSKLNAMIYDGEITSIKQGGRRGIAVVDLHAYVDALRARS